MKYLSHRPRPSHLPRPFPPDHLTIMNDHGDDDDDAAEDDGATDTDDAMMMQ
jgi:hypothetical protein